MIRITSLLTRLGVGHLTSGGGLYNIPVTGNYQYTTTALNGLVYSHRNRMQDINVSSIP
jgi:predicted metal-dependent RNase